MQLVVDTSAVVAVLIREPQRAALMEVTKSAHLIAPPSVHWEIGNAFAAMFKRHRLSLGTARRALEAYRQIPIRFSEVELDRAMELAEQLNIYAYDAYVILCAMQHRCALVSIDHGLQLAAARVGVRAMEIQT
jgi:predicted nucleic acid-binding protein